MRLLKLTAASLFLRAIAAVAIDPRAPPPVPPGTIFCELFVAQTGPPIVADAPNSPVDGLQVTTSTTQASLVANGFKGGYKYDKGGIGALDRCHAFYLNIFPSNTSYKQLVWQFDNQVTHTWSAGPGQLITTSSYPKSSFLACGSAKGGWFLYLKTGKDRPPGITCYDTRLRRAVGATTGI
ncbi:hypothetical protein FRB94_001998 [Tulasnella sp. JGI-2019a]|nr:hypothetical protein FRB94_001998 [Tulasnella sp. JGI-2019a]